MSGNVLEIEIFSAWNTYAVSMMSVLENCDMWRKTDTFQKFMCETGIAARFCVDKTCSPLPITDYDWMDEHTGFMERIGVQTVKYFAAPDDSAYDRTQKKAIQEVEKAIDNKRACVAWGIDAGEFGVIYGYDEEDKVFFVKGIGSTNTDFSLPVLYHNLGKTFEYAPVLYCEIPQAFHEVDEDQAFRDFLNTYIQEMEKRSDNPERAYGFAAYDMLIDAAQEREFNTFGLRYCTGIYHERKEAIVIYLSERQKEENDPLLDQFTDSFRKTLRLYQKLMRDVLQQDTDGWNHLSKPISEECYPEIISVLHEIKESEEKNVAVAKQMLNR